jgi:methanogenic corrinoid protein MtbC1
MSEVNVMAAEVLEASAAGFASAASAMLRQRPDTSPAREWSASEVRTHLLQRVLELAAAIRNDEPGLFLGRINWIRRALAARGADEELLRPALECLRDTFARELPESLRPAVEPVLRLAIDSLGRELGPEERALDPGSRHGRLALEYLSACLEARTDFARKLILDALDRDLSPVDAYTRVLLPAEREIGQLWHVGDVTVGEEHLVTETTRELMTLIAFRHAPPADPGKKVLLASVSGNAHDIGLRAAADLFRLAGWHAIYLGANVPGEEVVRTARLFGVRLIVLTATLSTQLNALDAAIRGIRQETPHCRILVGGPAFSDSPEMWRRLGADAFGAELESVVATAEQLIPAR